MVGLPEILDLIQRRCCKVLFQGTQLSEGHGALASVRETKAHFGNEW